MKKVYLSLISIGLFSAVSAQNNGLLKMKQSRFDNFSIKPTVETPAERAGGDILWSNDFTTVSDWVSGNDAGHTSGDWAIVNAMPSGLTSQVATYGFPSAMNSTSGGNFALVNSDAAGASATQNAHITTANGIDVAGLLTTNGSSLTTPLFVRFTEIYRHFYDENYLLVSNDGGATWTTFAVNTVAEVPVNTNSGDPEIEVVNITAAKGAGNWGSDVKIRFLYKGQYDWFWGVDDVEILEAYDNDIKISTVQQATDTLTTQALDYYIVPVSQTSFPGVNFGAKVINNGGAAQSSVALTVTGPSYNETGTALSIASGAADTLLVNNPYILPAAIGNSTVNITTTISGTDEDPSNNQKTMTFTRSADLYSRDNGTATGGISQVTSQDGLELSIGNVMEIFDPMTVTGVQVRLLNQAAAVGQQINCVIEKFDGTDFTYLAETDVYTIQQADLATFVTIPTLTNLDLEAGDVLLVMAHHFGGTDEVGFAYAQPTFQGTVLGYTADGSRFQLTDPNAIMIRLSEAIDQSSISENIANVNISLFPNPAADKATIEINGAMASKISIVDVTGKVVYMTNVAEGTSIITLSTGELASGIYNVNITTEKGIITRKLVVNN